MMNVISKVSYQDARLATTLSSLYCSAKCRNMLSFSRSQGQSVIFWERSSVAYAGRWCKWKEGCWHLALDVPQVLTNIKSVEVYEDKEQKPMACWLENRVSRKKKKSENLLEFIGIGLASKVGQIWAMHDKWGFLIRISAASTGHSQMRATNSQGVFS